MNRNYYNSNFDKEIWHKNKFIIGIILGMLIASITIKLASIFA